MRDIVAEKIFVLGCERSGSTWITNILDASPNVITYLEPFADYANLLPSFPPRYCHLDSVNNAVLKSIKLALDKLYSLKYPYFYKPGRLPIYREFDKGIVKYLASDKAKEVYQLLNLNNLPPAIKSSTPYITAEVVKDLRLNFKVGLLKQLYPKLRVLVSIRNPHLQVQSILNWFSRGNLGELKRNLGYFFCFISTQRRFDCFSEMLKKSDLENMETALFLYWLINYEILVEDLEKHAVDFKIIKNEELIINGIEVLDEALNGIIDEPMVEYFKNSSSGNMNDGGPTNTFRYSKKYLIEKEKTIVIDSAILQSIKNEYEFKTLKLYP